MEKKIKSQKHGFLCSLISFMIVLLCGGAYEALTQVRVTEEVIEAHISSEELDFRIIRVIEGLEHPWAIAWLTDGRMLVTERPGRRM